MQEEIIFISIDTLEGAQVLTCQMFEINLDLALKLVENFKTKFTNCEVTLTYTIR